jgi:Flp pilus assembly protein TadB
VVAGHLDDLDAAQGRGSPARGRVGGREVAAVRERAAELDQAVRRRDRIETALALALLPIFAWVAWATPHPASAAGAVIVALACVVIPIRLRLARRRRPDPGLPLAQ